MARYTHPNPRKTVEQIRKIRLSWLLKQGYLKGSDYKDIKINFNSAEHTIKMVYRPCRYGGKKWFIICGYKGCTKRVRILYEHTDYFTCRTCANLSYKSCNESNRYRSGYFKVLTKVWGSDDYYRDHVRTRFYRGRPTRKYKRYLKMRHMSDDEVIRAESEIYNFEQKLKR